jgi:hypothetical protein
MKERKELLSIIAVCAIGTAVASADSWIKDAATGVDIWNPNPATHETIVWSGNSEKGKASGYGIAVWRIRGKDTERAEGQWSDGRLDGHAVWSHANGSGYEGKWIAGAKSGCGIYTWPNGTSFLGEYQNDQRSHGRLYTPEGKPKKTIVSKETRELVYRSQDAAILARKAATRARIEVARAAAVGNPKTPSVAETTGAAPESDPKPVTVTTEAEAEAEEDVGPSEK